MDTLEQLPLLAWYGLLELWFVESHTSALVSPSQVLEWMVKELPDEWSRRWPNPLRHGISERAQAQQRAAEDLYGAAPTR